MASTETSGPAPDAPARRPAVDRDRVVVAGQAACDLVLRVSAFPEAGAASSTVQQLRGRPDLTALAHRGVAPDRAVAHPRPEEGPDR